MKKLFILVVVALIFSILNAGIKKTIWTQYGIVVLDPDSLVEIKADAIVDSTLTVEQTLTVEGNADFNDDVTIDSTLTVEKKVCFNCTTMLGDSADKVILPKGGAIEFYDTTDTDKFEIFDNGTYSIFRSDNPFKFLNNINIIGGDTTSWVSSDSTDTCYIVQDGTNFKFASDNPISFSRQVTFAEDVSRTGEGSCLFANGLPIGMTTPGDCQGMKMEFTYGVDPDTTGAGKIAQGLMLKMTMDKKWNFLTADRNADVRGASIQVELNNNLGGMLSGIYANAFTDIATNKTIIGEHTTGAFGTGMCAIEARTEIKGAGTITVPHIAGLYILHRRMGAGGVTGDYHAIHIENSQSTGAISGTETAIHFEPNTMAPPGANFDYGVDMNPVSFGTADHRLSSGATIANPHADTVKITEAITQFDGGEVLIDNGNLVVADGQKIVITDGTEADSFEIYHDGTKVVFNTNEPIKFGGGNVYIGVGDTLFFAYGASDTAYFTLYGTAFEMQSDLSFVSKAPFKFEGNVDGQTDGSYFYWDGWQWRIDNDGDDSLAVFIWHSTDTLKSDTISSQLEWTGSGGIKADKFSSGKGSDIASATTITVTHGIHDITGTANIDSIVPGEEGQFLIIQFDGAAASTGLVDAKNLRLAGNFSYSPDDVITLFHSGNLWFEISRSAN